MTTRIPTRLPFLIVLLALLLAPSTQARQPLSQADQARALDHLRTLDLPELDQRLAGLEARLASGALSDNDANLLCIGALTAPFAVAFGIGLVPNPPWDYTLGQVPAYAANLGLKFCPAVLDAPPDVAVTPNIDTADGADCAYDFSQPVIAGGREDFMGVPYQFLGNWGFTATPDSRAFGTPSVFHYNTPVEVRMLLPGEAPPGFLEETPEPQFVAEIGPFGIRAPQNDVFNAVGCLLDGSVPLSNEGGPCPVDLDRSIRLGVGTHTLFWRAETQVELLDTLPPIYVPGTPPGSKKGVAKEILRGVYEAAREEVAGEFLESYPSGVVNIQTQAVRVLDTTAPQLGFTDPSLATFRVEAQQPGGQSTRDLRGVLRDSILASDACNRTPQVTVPLPPFLPLGSHTITWTARDAGPAPGGGVNESTLLQTVIVEDTQPPQIAPPPSIVVESDISPVMIDTGSPKVFDVADLEPLIEYDGPADFPFGVTTVRWRAIDASGNISPWVEQTINIKPTGSNIVPVADNTKAAGLSFEQITVPLTASDADNDELYFYIDRQPDEGFFVAPLLPTFVEDLRIEAQGDPGAICMSGGQLPPQDYVFLPEYITTNDDGITFVLDRRVQCDDNSSTGITTDITRIARFGPDGELQAETFIGSERPLRLSFHPGGLPSAPEPFIYWTNPDGNPLRLALIDQQLNGPRESYVVDASAAQQNSAVDITIDGNGIVYVVGTTEMDAYDFEGRTFDVLDYLGPVDPTASELLGGFNQAWDADVDSKGNVYVTDYEGNKIHKFGASSIDRSVSPAQFTAGDYIGWLGRCTQDTAPGDAAACDVARQRSIGYACNDINCSGSATGDQPSQFNDPQGFAIDPNDILYVADRGNQRVQRFTPEGFFAGQAVSNCDAVNCFVVGQFGVADDVAVNSTSFYVLDSNTEILHIFAADPVTMTGPDSGFVTYRSNNNFIGADTFDWFASDGLRIGGELVRSNIATTTVNVSQNQRPPFATAGIIAPVIEDQATAILLDGSDPDIGDTYPWEPLQSLSAVLITPPNRGQVSINGLTATYTPNADYNDFDTFAFAVSDGVELSAPELVAVEVLPVNDAPVLTPPDDPADWIAGVGYPWELNVGVFDADPGDSHQLIVNWGDGLQENQGEILDDGTITGPLLDFNAGGEGLVHARHVYTSAAQRNAEVCVTDSAAAMNCETITVDVVPMTDLAVFERDASRAIATGTPITYQIAVSNYQGENGAGIAATGVTLVIDLDPRLTVLGITGASCTADGRRRTCVLPDLQPIPRGVSGGTPPIDRLVTINALADPALGPGTRITSSAALFASEINRNPSLQTALERVLVAAGDFIVDPVQSDSPAAMPGDGICADANGRCTLRAAIDEANALGGARSIALPDSLYRLDQGPLTITADLSLIGVGIGRTELVAAGAQRLFDIAPGSRLQLAGMTLTGDQPVISGSGGLMSNQGELLIEDALLQNGEANAGGAVHNAGMLTVRRSTFTANRAFDGGGSGGALFNSGSALIENTLFTNNFARTGGAATSSPSSGATMTLRHVTITGNQALVVGASLFGDFSDLPLATLERSILAGNSAGQPGVGGCWNQLSSAGGNLISDDRETCPFTPISGDLLDLDPALEPAIALGDGRIVLEPAADSPAMDALAEPCLAVDLRGLSRPQDGNGDGIEACDIGAFERGTAAAVAISPTQVDFGPVAPGGFSDLQNITIASTGNLPLTVTAIAEPHTPFTLASGDCPPTPFELAPGNSCIVQLRFAPVDVEPQIDLLPIFINTESSPSEIELLGNVTRPLADFDPGQIVFPDTPVAQSPADVIVTLGNTGDFPLAVDALTIEGPSSADFTLVPGQDGCSGSSVAPMDACGFSLRFTPSATGIHRASVRLDSNEPEGPRFIELLGTSDVLFFAGFE
ncbi:MAG: hypothetical protein Tsb002_37850 [Wenzhouxiangellaceae bacterium]